MNKVVRIATVVGFCLIVSSSALPQQPSQTTAPRDPKAASAQTSAPATQAPLAFGLTEDTRSGSSWLEPCPPKTRKSTTE